MARFSPATWQRLVHALAVALLLTGNILFVWMLLPKWLGLARGEVFSGSPAAYGVVAIAMMYGIGFVVCGAMLWVGRLRAADLGWVFDRWPRDLVLGVAGAVVCLAVLLVVYAAVFGAPLQAIVLGLADFTLAQRGQMLLIGLMAAFCEESVFRGYLQPELERHTGAALALPIQAVVFALYHCDLSMARLVPLFGYGLIYGGLRYLSGGLLAPAVAHLIFWNISGFL